jgi:hypothetical protein
VGAVVAIAALLLPARYVGYAGMFFFLNAFWGWFRGATFGKQERLVRRGMQTAEAGSSGS